jgi:flap endonuclease-1
MGLQIAEIVPKKEIKIEDLKGKIIAVDAFNALYQFLSNIRQPDGTPLMDSKKRVTSHLSGLFYRTTHLMNLGIRLVYVFDGISPELKAKTEEARAERKREAKTKYEEAKRIGAEEEMFKWARQTLHLTGEMIEESKQLLEALGIPVVQAPSEGEAQAAFIAAKGDAYAVASQDYDALAFGAPRLIQNLTFAKKRRTPTGSVAIAPSMIELDTLLNDLQINLEQMICLGILVGTDFNPKGVKGIGPKKALQLVKLYKQPVLLFDALQKLVEEGKIPEPDFDWPEIFKIFKKPDVTQIYDIKFKDIDEEAVKSVLCKEHDFSEERVNSALEKIRESGKAASQKQLEKWF